MADRNILEFIGGLNTVDSPDLIQTGYPYAQNVRRLLGGRTVARPPLGSNLLASTLSGTGGINSVTRLADPYNTPNGYAYVTGIAGSVYVGTSQIASGLSGNPISFLPYRPSASPKPFLYLADPSMSVNILNPSYGGYGLVSGMLKTDSNGNCYKSGIKEPQSAPSITVGTGSGPNWVSYRYVYRSAPSGTTPIPTGATSNPSPESAPQIQPQSSVAGNQVAATSGVVNSNVTYNASQYEGNGAQIRTSGSVSAGTLTDYVIIKNFGLSVPAGVNIDGVQVTLNWQGQYAGTGVLANVALYYQGVILGEVKSPGTQNAQTASTTVQGNGSDSWGTVLTPTITNDSTFGFGVQILTANSGGSDRSFLNSFTITVYYTIQTATGTCTPSTDPQVNTIDIYRQSPGLADFTYVLSVPNSSPSFTDTLSDIAISTNPILQFDNFEPFPSIDLPRSGTCTVSAVNEGVSNISILTPGTGQTNGTFTIPSTGGGGTGAMVQIIITGGVITTASVLSPGSGYTSAPSFIVSEGGTPGTLAASINPIIPIGPNVTFTSGDPFNVRWLPGTIILIQQPGSNSSPAYVLYNRPTSTTQLTAYTTTTSNTGFISFGFPPAGTGLTWQIAEPDLAAQPSPVIWGPTPDNAGSFYFGLDPNNPGDMVWSKGNNFDSAPDTNRLSVTSPSEILMNGTVTAELNTVFSTDRFWLIYPNFSDAVASVTGTLGQQWTLVQAASTRGLYMRYALGSLGSMIAWRAKDGIFISQGGGPEQDISVQIYNLFPHGGQAPSPITIAGFTVHPPNDAIPSAQTITVTPGYIFYNYQDTTSTPRTLCYDIAAKGWTVDAYSPTVNCHSWSVGGINQLLTGCTDGTIRALDSTGSESSTAILATPSMNGGSPRVVKRIGDIFLRANATSAISAIFWKDRYATQINNVLPASIGPASGELDYLFDFSSSTNSDSQDLGMVLSFPVGSGDWLKEWEPDWALIPQQIAAWRTGMLSYGLNGWLYAPWLRFAYKSTAPVTLTISTDQNQSVSISVPSSGGTPAKFFSWIPSYGLTGGSMKFKLLSWSADGGGSPFTVFTSDCELNIGIWGDRTSTIRPFREASGPVPGSTT